MDGRLRVTPAAWLWPDDRTAIAEHRDGLVALVRDTPEPVDGGLRFVRFDPRRAVGGSGAGAELPPGFQREQRAAGLTEGQSAKTRPQKVSVPNPLTTEFILCPDPSRVIVAKISRWTILQPAAVGSSPP